MKIKSFNVKLVNESLIKKLKIIIIKNKITRLVNELNKYNYAINQEKVER